jgi:cyclase
MMKNTQYFVRNAFLALVIASPFSLWATADSAPVFTPPLASTQKITDNLWIASTIDTNIVVLSGTDGPVVVDTSYYSAERDFTSAIQQFIQQQAGTDKAGTIILTHWHGDHTEGTALLRGPNTDVWAHGQTFRTMMNPAPMYSNKELLEGLGEQWQRVPADPKILPNKTFECSFQNLTKNNESITLFHLPNAHTGGDTVVYFKKSKVVATGDVFFNGLFPIIDRENGGSLRGTIAGVQQILSMIDDDSVVVPAHGKVTDKKGLKAYLNMLVKAQLKVGMAARRHVTEAAVVAAKPLEELKQDWTEKLVEELKAFGLGPDAIAGAQNLWVDSFVRGIYREAAY